MPLTEPKLLTNHYDQIERGTTMLTNTFDPCLNINGQDAFIGQFLNATINQGGLPGSVNNLVIDPTATFDIELEWQIDGILFNVNGVLGNLAAPNNWRIDVYAERMGPGADLSIYNNTEPGATTVATLPARWNHTCAIPANTLPEHQGTGQSGVYKLVCVVFADTNVAGSQDIIGYHEGPVILSENPN